jgi:hypothetical protein
MEQLFNPKDPSRQLVSYGFKSKIKSKGPVRRELVALRYLWELLSPITVFSARPFQIIAIKEIR